MYSAHPLFVLKVLGGGTGDHVGCEAQCELGNPFYPFFRCNAYDGVRVAMWAYDPMYSPAFDLLVANLVGRGA